LEQEEEEEEEEEEERSKADEYSHCIALWGEGWLVATDLTRHEVFRGPIQVK